MYERRKRTDVVQARACAQMGMRKLPSRKRTPPLLWLTPLRKVVVAVAGIWGCQEEAWDFSWGRWA